MEESQERPDSPPIEQVNGGSIKHGDPEMSYEIFGQTDDGRYQVQGPDDTILVLRGSEINWESFEDAALVEETLDLIMQAEDIAQAAATDAVRIEQLQDALASARQVVAQQAREITARKRELRSLKSGANTVRFSISNEVQRVFSKTGSQDQARHFAATLQRLFEVMASASSHVFGDMYRKATSLRLSPDDDDSTKISLEFKLKEGIDLQHLDQVVIGKGLLKATIHYFDEFDMPTTSCSDHKTGSVASDPGEELFSSDEMRGVSASQLEQGLQEALQDAVGQEGVTVTVTPNSDQGADSSVADEDIGTEGLRFGSEVALEDRPLYEWAKACNMILGEESEAELDTKEVEQLTRYIVAIRAGKNPKGAAKWIKFLVRNGDGEPDHYQVGIDARKAGQAENANPYAEGSPYFGAWKLGWQSLDA